MTSSPYEQMQLHHSNAFKFVSGALEIDEAVGDKKRGVKLKKLQALALYKKGIDELDQGIAVSYRCIGGDRLKADRLRVKISKTLNMAKERAARLEQEVENMGRSNGGHTSRALQKNQPAVMSARRTDECRSLSPRRTRPSSSQSNRPLPSTSTRPSGNKTITQTVSDRIKGMKGVDSKLAHLILDQVLENDPCVSFRDIVGLQSAKSALEEIVILPALKPELFTGLRSPVQGLLLFGPPGNGKTMLAKAVASEAKCVFFNISASALTSKWVGEAEKLVKALFALARELQPSVVFIDEVDSILAQRKDSDNEVSRRLKTEFLLQFDGVGTDSSQRILIMGATNRPFDLDEAVLRRFPKRIFVGLPDCDARAELLQNLLTSQEHMLTHFDFQYIARQTEHYSAYDLTALAKDAAMGPIREIPSNQLKNLESNQVRPITRRHFELSLRKIRASLNFEHLERLAQFNRMYGDSSS